MDMPRFRTTFFQTSLALAVVATLYLAFIPGDDSIGDLLDYKINHCLACATLSFLAACSFPRQRFGVWKAPPLLAFGVFIEVLDGLEGLLHVSEIADQPVEKPEELLTIGQVVRVKVINVDFELRKIGLSMKGVPQG